MDFESVNFVFSKIRLICIGLSSFVLMITYDMLTQKIISVNNLICVFAMERND